MRAQKGELSVSNGTIWNGKIRSTNAAPQRFFFLFNAHACWCVFIYTIIEQHLIMTIVLFIDFAVHISSSSSLMASMSRRHENIAFIPRCKTIWCIRFSSMDWVHSVSTLCRMRTTINQCGVESCRCYGCANFFSISYHFHIASYGKNKNRIFCVELIVCEFLLRLLNTLYGVCVSFSFVLFLIFSSFI